MSEPPREDSGAGLVWELPAAPPRRPGAPTSDVRDGPRAGQAEEAEEAGQAEMGGDPASAPEPERIPAPQPGEVAAPPNERENTEQGEFPLDDADLPRVLEALLFLSNDPLTADELADAAQVDTDQITAALATLGRDFAEGRRGLRLRDVGGGYTLATDPLAEAAARRLFSKPRVGTLTPAQAETLAIVAYLQPVSRPEITRIRGVSADSASATLLERGLVEESGRSQFGAVLYRTTPLFLKLFGLRTLDELPDVARWDPTPEEQAELRDRLLRAGEARAGGGPGPA